MEIMIVPDGHYYRGPDGSVFVESVFNYDFFSRYLQVFDKVFVVGRVTNVGIVPENMKLASGKNVIFLDLPSYKGPWQYAANYYKILKLAKKYSKRFDVAIFRLPGATANIMCKQFARTKKPYGIEVVVDPWDYFSKGTVKSLLRPIVRVSWTKFLKNITMKANGVSYVTKEYLQKNYPSYSVINGNSKRYFTTNYSSVSINSNSLGKPRKFSKKTEFVVSHVANSFSSYGKGHITLIKALKIVRDRNFNVKVIFIGDGPLKNEFMKVVSDLGLENYISFIGRLPDGNAVRRVMDSTDMLVFPTMAEGLPRVVLEAMSVGLPCISSPVSGIPEILSNEFLVNYNDYKGFADKITKLITNTEMMERASEQNIQVAKEYTEEVLNKRRKLFYEKLKSLVSS